MMSAVRSLLFWFAGALALSSNLPAASVRIGVIGDYGSGTTNEEAVANLVKSWQPDFIMTVGDNNYPYGEATTIDQNVGKFFHDYIYPYTGAYGAGAISNRFFPTVGNHDCCFPSPTPTGYDAYLAYFTLPGKERYYNYRYGPVEIFCLNSNPNDPDGWTFDSVQGEWLRTSLANSTATWRLVYFHHSPWSSGSLHGTSTGQGYYMRWPFKDWGATAVLTGHDHIYERMLRDGMTYLVIGIGGDRIDPFGTTDPYSQLRYNATYGALRIDATETNIMFRAINKTNAQIDTLTFEAMPPRLQLLSSGPPTQLRLLGSTGQNYVTDGSMDLNAWKPVSTNSPVAGSVIITDPGSVGFDSRFYRARLGH